MTSRVLCRLAVGLVTSGLLANLASAQAQAPNNEEGVPVTDPLMIAKCGSCHARDERGNMQRISWLRSTPEAWQDTVKRMIIVDGVELSSVEARSVIKYLSAHHGLAPEEAKSVLYDAERRIQDEPDIPENLSNACTKCHTFARALSWRRSATEWKEFADAHQARYKYRVASETVAAFLEKTAALHTREWDAWSDPASRPNSAANLAGRWLVTASLAGHGQYYGAMQVDPAGDDEFTTRVSLTSVLGGSTLVRSGRSAVYGGYAWRGRSKGDEAGASSEDASPDNPSKEMREVLWIAPDQTTAEGRWFWGQYQEFGFDVKLRRAPSDSGPVVLGVDRLSLKTGSRANHIRLIGLDFPAQIAPADLELGPGVTVSRIVSSTPKEVVAEVEVAADAPLGKRDVAYQRSRLTGAISIYDQIDYLKVTPESGLATFGNPAFPRGYEQFEATGYQRGADGKLHTDDDVELGPVEVSWSLEVFYAPADSSSDYVGKMSAAGLFVPASPSPNSNVDTWAVAKATSEKDRDGKPLMGKAYLVVTVPMYTLNGRRYVRDLGRWIDDGPAVNVP